MGSVPMQTKRFEGHFAEVRILVHPDVQGVYVRTSSPHGLRHVVPLGWVASTGQEWPLGFGRCRKSVIVRHTILEDPYMKLIGLTAHSPRRRRCS